MAFFISYIGFGAPVSLPTFRPTRLHFSSLIHEFAFRLQRGMAKDRIPHVLRKIGRSPSRKCRNLRTGRVLYFRWRLDNRTAYQAIFQAMQGGSVACVSFAPIARIS